MANSQISQQVSKESTAKVKGPMEHLRQTLQPLLRIANYWNDRRRAGTMTIARVWIGPWRACCCGCITTSCIIVCCERPTKLVDATLQGLLSWYAAARTDGKPQQCALPSPSKYLTSH